GCGVSTGARGLRPLRRGLIAPTSLATALPLFAGLDLDQPARFEVGGHAIRRSCYRQALGELHQRSNVFDTSLIEACSADLDRWTQNVRTGSVLNTGATIARLADLPEAHLAQTARAAIERLQADLQAFREAHRLAQVVVVCVGSTEPPFEQGDVHASLARLVPALEERHRPVLPASSLYAWAALDLGFPYVNFTPSLGGSFPAIQQLAVQRGA